jgi:tRNA A37 threonylcarbamoyladenosine modification protein TsaB
MKIKLDLSTSKLSKVSLIDGDKTVGETSGPNTLALIDALLKKHNLKLSQLEEIESYPGPGSYTGLKIGAAIANTLNFTLGKNKRITPIYEAKNEK